MLLGLESTMWQWASATSHMDWFGAGIKEQQDIALHMSNQHKVACARIIQEAQIAPPDPAKVSKDLKTLGDFVAHTTESLNKAQAYLQVMGQTIKSMAKVSLPTAAYLQTIRRDCYLRRSTPMLNEVQVGDLRSSEFGQQHLFGQTDMKRIHQQVKSESWADTVDKASPSTPQTKPARDQNPWHPPPRRGSWESAGSGSSYKSQKNKRRSSQSTERPRGGTYRGSSNPRTPTGNRQQQSHRGGKRGTPRSRGKPKF